MYWDKVLEEVLHRDDDSYPAFFTHVKRKNPSVTICDGKISRPRKRQEMRLYLGETYSGVYLTYRESQTMLELLKGHTIRQAADCLELSPRTIEYYIKNMKSKFKCRTKSALIGEILKTNFIIKMRERNKKP